MNKAIVGYTGFVGGNIASQDSFEGLYNSKNIESAYGTEPDLLIYAGVPAEMFIANKDPEGDKKKIEGAIANIKRIAPKRLVLISSVSVYDETVDVDETHQIEEERLTPYGLNRLYLEKWILENMDDSCVVRLPALYGKGLKKNFVFDYINRIPAMLNQAKFDELEPRSETIRSSYSLAADGFYHVRELDNLERKKLYQAFINVGFSALNFTDSRSVYQFYWLGHLWWHIQIALQNNIDILNICTEPLSVKELYYNLEGTTFANELNKPPFNYNIRSIHADLFGGHDGYLQNKETVLKELSSFISKERNAKWN